MRGCGRERVVVECIRLVRVGIDKCVVVGVGVGVCESVGVKGWSREEIRGVAWA